MAPGFQETASVYSSTNSCHISYIERAFVYKYCEKSYVGLPALYWQLLGALGAWNMGRGSVTDAAMSLLGDHPEVTA